MKIIKINYFNDLRLKSSVVLSFSEFDFGDGFSFLFELFSSLQISFSHLLQIFFKQHFSLLAILSFLSILENGFNMFLKLIRMSYINQLQSVFYSDFSSASQIIHEELNKIKKVSWFKPGLIENASLIHECEFILINTSIQILIDLPNPLVDFGFAEGKT